MGIVTVVTSGKGGVGKSAVSAGLATELAKKDEKVLIIDADSGLGNLDYILSIKENLVYDISDIILGNCEITDAIYRSPYIKNLYLIPAAQSKADGLSTKVMKKLISVFSSYYDQVIIDSPAGIGTGFESSIASADRAIIVANTNPVSLMDSRKVRDILIDSGINDIRLVINRFSNHYFRKSDLYEDLDTVIDESGIQLIAIVPEDNDILEKFSKGLPLSDKSSAKKAFERLSARFLGERVPLPSLRKL